MATDDPGVQRTFERLSRQQLEIYARELREHVREERRLREKMAAWNGQLECMVEDMTAMNNILRERLSQRFGLIYAYRDVLDGLRKLSKQASTLMNARLADMPEGLRKLAEEINALELQAKARELEVSGEATESPTVAGVATARE